MHFKFYSFLLPLLLTTALLSAQVPKDAAIPVTATFTTSPASVTISWPNPAASSIIILRHTKISPPGIWTSLVNVTASTQSTYVDNAVSAGQTYEYSVQRTVGNVTSYGYAHVAINAPVVDNRGKIIFLVDSLLMSPLGNEVGQMKLDMMGEGWTVVPHIIGSGATVQSIKNQIVADYNADPFNVKMVFLLGALPVPYSGNTAWDSQINHQGAWPADSYYGDVNGIWTDVTVNNTTATRSANDNIPGDKKFDQNIIPSAVELAVGRVDFRHLSATTFGTSQVELYRRYLNKDHAWRTKAYTVANKALIDDNLGYSNGEAFAANGYRNAYPLVGAANVVEGDFFGSHPDGYLLGFGAGTGTYNSAAGVGTSANFASNTVNVAFSMFYGDYFGDWDSEEDPFLPSALASRGGILTSVWAGRPHVFFQGLASGETVGYCIQETQNAQYNTGFFPSYGESGTHVSLLGDPTLRAHVVAPPTNLTAAGQCGTVTLNWTAPAGGAPGGYHIYRGLQRNGIYDRLTENPVTTLTFADNAAPGDTLYYQVRAVEQVSNPGGGSYANTSIGATVSIIFAPSGVPVVDLTGGTLTCTHVSVALGGVNPPNTATWSGPGGFTSTQNNPSVTLPGAYSATVTAANGCTTVSEVAVLIDTFLPTFTIPPFPPLSCLMPCGVINLPETPGYQVVLDGVLLQSGVNYNVCDTGLHTVILRSLNNGCEDTYSANVVQDIAPPGATAGSSAASCNPPFQLQGGSSTAGVTFAWNGPDEFFSTEQNPIVTAVGTYQLIVRNPINGCTSTASVTITPPSAPDASATGATLNCGQQSAIIQGNSTTANVTFSWTGPNGFTSNQQNPTVTQAGIYVLTVTTTSGCSNTAITVVSSSATPPDATATGAELGCNQSTATIHGNSTTAGATFAWTGPSGFTSSQQNPVVSLAGTYLLTVTAPGGCTATATAVVTANAGLPNVTAVGASITCAQLLATLHGNSTTTGVTFAWTGPNGFTSTQQNPTVTVAGTYVLTVTAPSGCTNTASAVVTSDVAIPNVSATGITLNCTQPTTELPIHGNSTTPGVTYFWTGPNGFTSTQQNPPAILPGTYVLVVTAPNGCTNSATAVFAIDITPPNASATGASLTCSQSMVAIQGTSSTTGATFIWTGPDGFTSSLQNPTVTLPGTYVLMVSAPNGCTSTATAVVTTNGVLPNATALGAVLTCNQPLVTIQGNSTTMGATFAWTGPDGFTSNLQNPVVSLTGIYTLTVTAPNGCTSTATALVSTDAVVPNVTANGATLTCSQPSVTIQGLSTTSDVTFHWTGPQGFTSNQQNPIVTVSGTYVLTVTALNGCTNTASATVNTSITLPNVTATGTVLTCSQPIGTLHGSSFTSGSSFMWTGPGGFTSTDANPTVSLPGTYLLTLTAANSCTNTATAIVTVDASVPNVTATGTTLTCSQPSGTIHGNSTTPDATYLWNGPGGFTSTQPEPVVSVAGIYILVVTVPNGCSSSASTEVVADVAVPTIAIIQSGSIDCNTPCVTVLANSTTPGTIPFTQEYCMPGTYTAVLTAPNGCTNSQSFEVLAAPPLALEISGETVDCEGINTIGVTATGGTLPYQYQWSTGDTTAAITVLPGTILTVDVSITDAGGCSIESPPITLIPFLPIAVGSTVIDESGVGLQNGSITLTVQGSSCSTYTYLWNTGDTTSTIVNLSGGIYTATVTCQLTGCTAVVTVTVQTTVGTEDAAFWQQLSLAPNPANGQALLTVRLAEATALRVKILDATGRLVLSLPETILQEGSLPLDVRNCPPGMYTVLLSTKNETAVRKLAIVRE